MKMIDCADKAHNMAIAEIFNDAILNTTALYEYTPRSSDDISSWFKIKRANNHPVIGVINSSETLMGFASFGSFRPFPANKYTVEHSVYVHPDHRRKGLGRLLLREIVNAANELGYHTVIGGIDAGNNVSIALHESMGFFHSGTIRQAGFKFGRWLDLAFYQKILDTPPTPVDG